MIVKAFLCGHDFDTENFQNYPDDYAGYCPECIRRMEDDDDNFSDVDPEEDGNGVPIFDGDSFSEDDNEDDENTALDDYEEEDVDPDENIDPMAEETQEDIDREVRHIAESVMDNLDSIYKPNDSEENYLPKGPWPRDMYEEKPRSTVMLRNGIIRDPAVSIGEEFMPKI